MSEVRVRITDELGGNETIVKNVSGSTTKPTIGTSVKDVQAKADTTQNALSVKAMKNIAAGGALLLQAVRYVSGNVGKWTGNSHTQAVVNNGMEMVGYGMMIHANPIIGLSALGFKVATTAIDYQFESQNDKYTSERRLARAGFNSAGEAIGFRRNKT